MVRAGADFSAITKQAQKASQSMRGMQNSVSRSCNAMSNAAAGLKKAFMAVGAAVSVRAIVNFAKDAAEAYDKQVEGEMKLAQVMRNTMQASNAEIQSILDLTAAQQRLGVVGDEVQLAGAQQLSTYLKQSSSLEALIPVMNDLAVQQYGYNVTAEQTTSIAKLLGKAMEGQTGALTRYGFAVDDAQKHVLQFGTESERVATLAEIVTRSVGGMNTALAATPTGRMKQLANTMSDIKEQFGRAARTLGTVLLPVLNTVAKVLSAIATLANKVAQTIANVFGGTAAGKEWQYLPPSTVSAIDDAADATDNLTNSTNQAAQAAKKAKEAFQQASFDTLHILTENDSDESSSSPSSSSPDYGTGSGADDAADMIREVATASEEAGEGIAWLEKLLEKVKNVWKDFTGALDFTNLKEAFGKLKEAFAPLSEDLGKALKWLYDEVLKPLAAWTISELAPRLVEMLASAFKFLHGVFVALQPLLEAIWPILKWFAEIVGFAITRALDELNHALSVLGDWMAGNLSDLEMMQASLQMIAAITLTGIIGDLISLANAAGAAATAAAGLGAAIGFGGTAAGVGMAVAGGGTLIGALGAGSGAMGLLGGSITGVAVPALTAGTGAAAAATAGVAGLAGPIAAVVAIVAALGIATYEVITHWDQIKDVAARAVDGMKRAWNGAADWFRTNVSDPLKEWGKQAWEDVKSAAQEAAEKVRETWNGLRTTLKTTWDNIKTAGNNAWNSIKETATAAWDAAYQGASKAWESAKSGAATAWETVKSTWGQAGNYFNTNVFQPLINAVKTGIEKVQSVFSSLSTIVENVVAKVRSGIQTLQASVPSLENVKSSISSAIGTISSKVSSVISSAKTLVTSGLASFSSLGLPQLASGAVIPPNREFVAVLGDQTSGYNIETPESLLRQVVREESSNGAVLMILSDILDAVRDGKEITVDGYKLGQTVQRSLSMSARANGIA
jgi:phage-related protein/predicted  nucleic acid-binding Zn-ribbon protein